ncbi:hypothetical protein F4808DRAFT_259018 [Astrocystis sublimbata]|nr:hypothetical protein F4808DRAFT_259018 [Astrocystis sublimbata]
MEVYAKVRRLDDAAMMCWRLAQINEEIYGSDHVWTLGPTRVLGHIFSEKGDYREAGRRYLLAYHGMRKTLGAEHPATLEALSDLGINDIYSFPRPDIRKGPAFNLALPNFEKCYGYHSQKTLQLIDRICQALLRRHMTDEAEELCMRSAAGWKKHLGCDDLTAVHKVATVAFIHLKQDKLEEAEKDFTEVLAQWEKLLGRNHHLTMDAVANLGLIYSKMKRWDDAWNFMWRAAEGYDALLGANNETTRRAKEHVDWLANLYGRDCGNNA